MGNISSVTGFWVSGFPGFRGFRVSGFLRRSSSVLNVWHRSTPRWVMWQGMPGNTHRPRLGISQAFYIYSQKKSRSSGCPLLARPYGRWLSVVYVHLSSAKESLKQKPRYYSQKQPSKSTHLNAAPSPSKFFFDKTAAQSDPRRQSKPCSGGDQHEYCVCTNSYDCNNETHYTNYLLHLRYAPR